jgi:hypothetical protein
MREDGFSDQVKSSDACHQSISLMETYFTPVTGLGF